MRGGWRVEIGAKSPILRQKYCKPVAFAGEAPPSPTPGMASAFIGPADLGW
jgi:hypothetical protein